MAVSDATFHSRFKYDTYEGSGTMIDPIVVTEKEIERFLTLFRRIPTETIQSMATRELLLTDAHACLVSWAVRDELLRSVGVDDPYVYSAPFRAESLFGGKEVDWRDVFQGVCYPNEPVYVAIETAFTLRLLETVG